MREADTGLFRVLSIAGFFFILCLMLAFAAILGPPRRTRFALPKKNFAVRDLEFGDPERESLRDRGLGRGRPYGDEYDIFGNPWKNRSLDSVAAPRAVYIPNVGDFSHGMDAGDTYPDPRRGLDLPDPDIFDIATSHGEDPFADPIPEPAPVRPGLMSFRAWTGLTPRMLRWKMQALGDGKEEKGEDRDIECPPATTDGVPDIAALSAAAAAPRTQPEEPFPEWLVTPKASAGPRAPRFFEVDVDGPAVNPPDLDFVAMQQELLKRVPIPARPGMPRSSTWHPSQVAGEEFSRPVVARNHTTAD